MAQVIWHARIANNVEQTHAASRPFPFFIDKPVCQLWL